MGNRLIKLEESGETGESARLKINATIGVVNRLNHERTLYHDVNLENSHTPTELEQMTLMELNDVHTRLLEPCKISVNFTALPVVTTARLYTLIVNNIQIMSKLIPASNVTVLPNEQVSMFAIYIADPTNNIDVKLVCDDLEINSEYPMLGAGFKAILVERLGKVQE